MSLAAIFMLLNKPLSTHSFGAQYQLIAKMAVGHATDGMDC